MAGATIQVEGPTKRNTVTDAAGAYTLLLPVGSYTGDGQRLRLRLADAPRGVVITEGATTSQSFALAAAPAHAVSGTVREATAPRWRARKVTHPGHAAAARR